VYLPQGIPYEVIAGPAVKLILAMPGGIEDFFDGLAADLSFETLTHRHGVRFLE
jgi:hypothetical protein